MKTKSDKNEVSHADAFILSAFSEVTGDDRIKVAKKFNLPKKLSSPAGRKIFKYLMTR